ncbi:MAG: adenosylmethionine--8-amino-7-oxononanoate transaminase [Crocinitomicaceae bacterium]|nr:adenosylmethionine--8-amino-7-oxononanoate transaminase [Crocinitomicaceae bacterium]|tara:strand:- start:21761 stop:23041 length:1281 start_codon:yes stop_codon:yes gene_type:complete
MSIANIDKKNIWHPFSHYHETRKNIVISQAKDEFLYDENGNQYIDSVASWWVNLHGHSNPYIAEKIAEQAQNLEHVIFAGFTHEPAVTFSEKLLELLPDNQEKLFFSDNGSTSTEIALKLALQSFVNRGERKIKVIALEGAYHGDTLGAMSVSSRGLFTEPFHPFLYEVCFLPLPTVENERECIAQLEKVLDTQEAAAFIFEPLLQAAGGMRMYDANVLCKLVELCKKHGVITIADEVVTAFYRTGKFLASDQLSSTPDIICMAKGVTGGTMAMGVTSCNRWIVESFETKDRSKTFYHGHSFTGNPIACSAAVASLDLLETSASEANRKRISSFFESFKLDLEQNTMVRNARCLGHILAFEIEAEESNYLSNLRDWIYDRFLEEGILMRPLGNTICFIPSYCISQDSLEHIRTATFNIIKDLSGNQ